MSPPKPILTWAQVVDLDFLSMIEILRGRNDVRYENWAQPHFRTTAKAWHKLQRAKEELVSVGVEARRLWTSMCDEEDHLQATLASLKTQDPCLGNFLELSSCYRLSTNAYLRSRLLALENLPMYSAKHGPGVCLTSTHSHSSTLPPILPPVPADSYPANQNENSLLGIGNSEENGGADEDEDDYNAVMDKLADALGNLDTEDI